MVVMTLMNSDLIQHSKLMQSTQHAKMGLGESCYTQNIESCIQGISKNVKKKGGCTRGLREGGQSAAHRSVLVLRLGCQQDLKYAERIHLLQYCPSALGIERIMSKMSANMPQYSHS